MTNLLAFRFKAFSMMRSKIQSGIYKAQFMMAPTRSGTYQLAKKSKPLML
jgi:hypothetical protein